MHAELLPCSCVAGGLTVISFPGTGDGASSLQGAAGDKEASLGGAEGGTHKPADAPVPTAPVPAPPDVLPAEGGDRGSAEPPADGGQVEGSGASEAPPPPDTARSTEPVPDSPALVRVLAVLASW